MEIYVRMTEGRDRGRKKSVDRTLGLDMIEGLIAELEAMEEA